MIILRILLFSFVVLTLAFVFDFNFNKWIPFISLALFFIYEIYFCWFHPIIGLLGVVSLGGTLLITSYEMDRIAEKAPKHKGLFYTFMGVFGGVFVFQIVETFAGRLF